jgi:transposase InsO family protein
VSTATLAVGARVAYDGEVWSVVDVAGSRATIERAGGPSRSVAITRLLSPPNHLFVDDSSAAAGLGQVFSSLDEAEGAQLSDRLAHVRELLTGYRSGDAAGALPGEPRPSYDPARPRMDRYQAKAAELGIGMSTLRRWVAAYKEQDVAGLLDLRHHRRADPLRHVDQRWLDMLAAVLAEHTPASRPPRHLMLERVAARVEALHGPGVVPIPKEWKGREALAATTKGTNALSGATKAKRSIAGRPPTPYGRLQATRPGEYLVLDTNSLDVFAMEPLTLRWVSVQLSVAMDLCSRSIVALRLSPVSTKAVDAAVLLYEAISPDSKARTSGGILPYPGVPSVVLVDPDKATDRPGLPAVVPETLVVDHGKIYLSEHLRAVCARFGISIQPARPYRATDKGALERFFRTLREDLLAALPGYKGPDVYSRGEQPEAEAYYFIDELEQVLREWVAERYHRLPHDGLVEPAVPGLALSPAEMFEAGVARAGRLRVPARADLAYDFLPVEWRTIQHYGVELRGLRYDGPGITPYRDRRSPYTGRHEGLWPVRYDPDDVSKVFFQNPDDHRWHTLRWAHAPEVAVPFSAEALAYARRLARQTSRFPDDRRALAELLERWDAGLTRNPTERRMALRMSQQRAARLAGEPSEPTGVEALATVRALFGEDSPPEPEAAGPDGADSGDDDDEGELTAVPADEAVSDADFYRDAFGTIP